MLNRLFARRDPAIRAAVDALYEQIVAAARQPLLYSEWAVPDTPLGRYEMVSLHMFLFLRRVRGAEGKLKDVAQNLTDEFFKDVDHSLRELGISDMGLPKRIKKLAKMFYGRVASYGDALDREDLPALQQALRRNVRPDQPEWAGCMPLAAYVRSTAQALERQGDADLCQGRVAFPAPRDDLSGETKE